MANESNQQQKKAEERKPADPGSIATATVAVSEILAKFDQGEQRRILAGAAQIVGLPLNQNNNRQQQGTGRRG